MGVACPVSMACSTKWQNLEWFPSTGRIPGWLFGSFINWFFFAGVKPSANLRLSQTLSSMDSGDLTDWSFQSWVAIYFCSQLRHCLPLFHSSLLHIKRPAHRFSRKTLGQLLHHERFFPLVAFVSNSSTSHLNKQYHRHQETSEPYHHQKK